jgi:hypothetical protein
MSDSYPTIADSLSAIEQEFMGCVEMHLDPPEHDDPTYAVEALWELDDGGRILFRLSVDETDPDISERRHSIEFLDVGAKVEHSMKRIEASQGRLFWTESEFHVHASDVPRGILPSAEVEREVHEYVERVRVLDRERRLTEL